ncbi:MAG: preprotein translocase subunit SecY [Desulfarculales bacterium]|jgi:preprotein translocase subunit SecY|nr:preprotein translocase subunit SecY [Desulfarculales bacterium]
MQGIANIGRVPELKRRLLFVLLMLTVYRIGCAVPTPGIDSAALAVYFARMQSTIVGMLSMFSGGALEQMSIFALGIMPYISASIIMQLLTVVVPHLSALKKEGQAGQKKINQYSRYGTILLGLIQGYALAMQLEVASPGNAPIVAEPGWSFRLMTMFTLTAGTAFIMWMGEQINERGVGNGISLIIFAGIVARLPSALGDTFSMINMGEMKIFELLFIVVLMLAVIAGICFVEQGQRRLPVQYAKRVVGRRMYGGQSTHLPLKINVSGVIPPIFASSLLMLPGTLAVFAQMPWMQSMADWMSPTQVVYNLIYVTLIFFFAYFYTAVTFNPVDVAENMKKQGGFIVGIRPGKRTAEYIDKVLTRLTLSGACYLSLVCILPTVLISQFNVQFVFGGTALLIVVGVSLDTVAQIEGHLLQRQYEGFLKKGVIRGRSG